MFTGDKAAGMVGSIAEVFPEAAYQRCTVHFYRNVLARVPKTKSARGVAAMLKAIHAMESREAAEAKALEVASTNSSKSRLGEAAMVVGDGCAETLTYTQVPPRALAAHTGPTTPSSASTARFADARAWSAPSPTGRVGPHARDREAQVRCRERVGLPALPGRDSAG